MDYGIIELNEDELREIAKVMNESYSSKRDFAEKMVNDNDLDTLLEWVQEYPNGFEDYKHQIPCNCFYNKTLEEIIKEIQILILIDYIETIKVNIDNGVITI